MSAFFWTDWLSGWRLGLPMDAASDLYQRATTMTFAAIVAAQVGNVFACRTDHQSVFRVGLTRNRMVFAGVAAEVAILLGLILVPPLRHLFGLALLAFAEWGILLVFPLMILLLEEIRKCVQRRVPQRS
jgi:magnesium-transporting ATPase (P-type)